MSAQTRIYWDLVCDHDGCAEELSAYSDQGYADEHDAIEAAEYHDWQHAGDGRDFCPKHVIATDDDDEGA